MRLTWSRWLLVQPSGERGLSRRRFWLGVMLPGLLIFLVANLFAAVHSQEIAFYHLVVDPLEYANLSPYIGALSVLGCLLWMAAASLCLGTASLLASARKFPRPRLHYMVCLGGLLLVLLMDDTYRLHENFKSVVAFNDFLKSLDQDWFEGAFFLFYAVSALWIFKKFRRTILQSNLYILSCFLILMIFSTAADLIWTYEVPFCHQLEEGSKFLGIVAMVGYCLDLSHRYLRTWRTLDRV